jgi:arylsulfatase A-like enzyme
MTRPNILYVHSHDTGRYISPYGFDVDTPNFQRLADEGFLFRQAFASAPTCSPSRAGLLTGQSPHSAGMLGLVHRGFRLNDPSQHLATILRDTGYQTSLYGIQHVGSGHPTELGYQHVEAHDDRSWSSLVPRAVEAIHTLGDDASGAPFFMDIGFVETHRPFPPVDSDEGRYVRPPAPLPDVPEIRYDMATYHASVRQLDGALGMILDALDEAGLAESTLVIATTDHGIAFPLMKCNCTDHGTGVLLILRGPGGFSGGKVSDALVSQVDVFPTICDVLQIDHPAWLQGTSLLPLVDGTQDEVNEEIFAEVTYHAAYEPQRAIRTQRWTYIRRFDDRELPVLPNCDDGESRDFLLDHGWDQRPIAPEQLYDNLFDPNQGHNVIDDPAAADVASELRERLRAWMERTDDPLLDGPVPLPAGAAVNDPASRSFLEDLLVAQEDGTVRRQPNPRTLR